MKQKRFFPVLLLTGLLICLSLWPISSATADPATPRQAIENAWQLAQASGRYHYRSLIDQTTLPAPRLSNAGRPPRQEQLGIEGWLDQPAETMEMTLWRDASFNPDRGVAIRVEGDRAYTRTGQGDWEETDNVANVFAPGGDPLSFLAGITNIQSESDTGHFSFDIDGSAFAAYIGPKLQQQLAERGELPPGINLQPPDYYRQMTGTGEIWLDAAGLPGRFTVQLDLGEQKNGERVTAEIRHTFYDFDTVRIEQSQASLLTDSRAWFDYHIAGNVAAFQQLAHRFTFLAIVLGAAFVMLRYGQSRRFYTAVVGSVIAAMLVSPLLQAHHVEAFGETQQTRQAAAEARQAKTEQLQQAQTALTTSDWNPHQNPLEETYSVLRSPYQENTQYAIRNTQYAIQASTTVTTTDSDGDGLSDADEATWLTCAYSGSPNFCTGVSNPTDSDGDGLSDGIEVNNLGILPSQKDTDGDAIYDNLEVQGFSYNGTTWYLDPNETDTNSDGLLDSVECSVWSDTSDSYNPAAICPDTDSDGTPDLFSDDNDGDGVEDVVDLSPWTVSADTYNDDNPLSVTINSLQTNVPVMLEIQFRPTMPEHLTYSGVVLDWPSGDGEGQVTRYRDTTFATTDNSDILSSDANAANGDVRLTPMLEITMPYTNGHYANLPVNATYSGTNRVLDDDDAVGDWLDETELDPYGITVRDVDETSGDLVAYIPLSTVNSDTGDETQAYGATMLYYPTQGTDGIANWGEAHQFRVVWWVQMITDDCVAASFSFLDLLNIDACDGTDTLSLIHTYEEDWKLTGLEVSEEHGLDVGLIYENPTLDDDLSMDDQLWLVSWNLSNTFVNGRDCDTLVGEECQGNGQRDVTIANLESKIDDWSDNSSFAEVDTFSYLHQGYIASIMMTETVNILNTVFTPYANETYPLILLAQETAARVATLDEDSSLAGSSLTMDLNGLETQTTAAISWATYQYVDEAWDNMAAEDYLTLLDWQLQSDSFFQAADDSTDSSDEAEGKRIWAQLYYVSLYNGLAGLAAIANNSTWTSSDNEVIDAVYVSDSAWSNASTAGLASIAKLFLFALRDALYTKIVSDTTINFWLQLKYNLAASAGRLGYSTSYLKFFKWTSSVTAGMVILVVVGALAIAGAALLYAGYASGDQTMMKVGEILMNVAAIIFYVSRAIGLISTIVQMYQTTQSALLLTRLNQITASYRPMGAMTLIITLGIIWGFFLYKLFTGAIEPGTLKFELYLAYSIAASIVVLALFFLQYIPVVGPIIVMLILIIDVILKLFNVKGIQQSLTEWVAEAIFDVDAGVRNMDDPDRLTLSDTRMSFVDDEAGFAVTNSFYYTVSVVNKIYFREDEPYSGVAYGSKFGYLFQTSQRDQYHDMGYLMSDLGDWRLVSREGHGGSQYTDPDYWKVWLRLSTTAAFTQPISLSNAGMGINRDFDGKFYFTEMYALPYESCWEVNGVEFNCSDYFYSGSNHLNMGANVVFDIFPASLSEFVSLDWNDGTLAFPAQNDQDGDGLLNSSAGGADTDDTTADSDGDGLTDYYELNNGLDAEAADGDEDGLNDMAELAYDTNPYAADSDSDGLSDYTERVTGWLVVYNSATNATTRVWSDPNIADEDDDTLSDMEEFIFGFHPQVETDPSVIQDLIAFDNVTVNETESPLFLLQFEELEGVSAFADSSGEGYTTVCDNSTAACPTAAESGRYRTGLLFDGTNDHLDTGESVTSLAKADFSIGAWVRTSSSNSQAILSKNDGDASWEQGEKSFYIGSDGRPAFVGWGNAYIRSTTAVNNGQWHHVMVVWDYSGSGTSGTGKLYVDGVDVTSTSTTNYAANNADKSGDTMRIGRPNYGENNTHFTGNMDEVIVFDRALAAAEVLDIAYGRYNLNDLNVLPGQDLIYQATVTNTQAAQEGNGYLVADSTYLDPALTTPEVVLRFEEEDYMTTFYNSVGESSNATCPGDGTCPTTGVEGKYNTAVQFDGLDDAIELPSMGDAYEAYSMAFWLNVSALPAAGSTAAILTTDRTDIGRLNIYLNSSGNLVFDILGNTTSHTSAYTFSSHLNAWHHVAFIYLIQSGGSGSSKIYIDASSLGAAYDSNVSYSTPQDILVGPGWLGNNTAGTAPYNGKLDEFVFYNDDTVTATSQSQNDELHYVYAGTYWVDLTNYGPLRPSFLLKFNDTGADYTPTSFDADQTSVADAVCQSTAACPGYTDSGYDGGALIFDGSDDYLYMSASQNTRDTDLTFYAKIDAWPSSGTNDYFLDTTSTETSAVDLYLNSSGKLVVQRGTTSVTSSGSLATGSWKKIRVNFVWGSDGLYYYYRANIYFNDVLDSAQNLCYGSSSLCPSTIKALMGSGRIGNSTAGTSAFDGTLDEFSITSATYSFDAGTPATVALINRVNDAQLASCVYFYTCPSLDSAGAFGSALNFDGDDYLYIDPGSAGVTSLAKADFSIGAWVRTSSTSSQAILSKNDGDTSWEKGEKSFYIGSNGRPAFVGYGNAYIHSTIAVNDGQWHHVMVVWDYSGSGTSGTGKLYVDGADVTNSTTNYAANNADNSGDTMRIGRPNYGENNTHFTGTMDELVILSEAISADVVELLMNSTWPAIAVADDFVSFTAPTLSTAIVTGTATVNDTVPNSQHQFDEEVEVAFTAQEGIVIPVVDNNAADLTIYLPFEEIPGLTAFENVVDSSTITCDSADTCPLAGLRGLVDRAAYFDGADDHLTLTENNSFGSTYAVWVKADQGTILETRDRLTSDGLALDVNQLFVAIDRTNTDYYQSYTLPLNIPDNKWTHVAAVFNYTTGQALVYINGSLSTYTSTVYLNNGTNQVDNELNMIGANADGSDPLRGYLDDLRVYDTALSASSIQTLYAQTAPLMRFEFDEDSDATTFADSSRNGYTGTPTFTTCADFSLLTLTPSSVHETDVTHVYLAVNGEWLFYEPLAEQDFFPNLSTTICGTSTVTLGMVRSSGVSFAVETVNVTPTTIGDHAETFENGSNRVASTWNVNNTFYLPNPLPGTDGQIGNTALFDGAGSINVADAASAGNFGKADFAIAVWVKTTATSVGLVVKTDGDSSWEQGEKAFYLDSSGLPTFVGWGNAYIRSTTAVNDDIWHHVAVVWDYSGSGTAGTGRIYVDGLNVTNASTTNYAANNNDKSADTIKIGASNYNAGEAPNNFVGQLDEFVVYSRALLAAEIYSIYLRELGWYRDHSSSIVTVDLDTPSITLLSNTGYHANQYIQLAVAASDPSSPITLLDFGLKTPGDTTFSWQGASPCQDSTSVWCPAFDPSTLDGEGTYEVQFRAVDAVGHETTSSSYTFYVDNNAPTIASSYSGTWLPATTDPDDDFKWTLALSGSISDPTLSNGAAGSGIYTPTVIVSLVDGTGETVGVTPQTAAVSGSTWSIVYEVTGLRPVGTYTVTMMAEDNAGNQAAASVGTIKVDARPSKAQVNFWQLPEVAITTTQTLNGVVGDMPIWGGAVLQLHLEEAAGSTIFYDYDEEQNNMTCSGTTCPTVVTGGPFGQALEFDGVDDRLFTDASNTVQITQTVSLALWVNPDTNTGHTRRYISLGADKAVLRMENNNRLDFYVKLNNTNQHIRISGVMTTGEWQHLAGTYDGTTMRLYRNGIQIGSVNVTGTMDNTSYVNIGTSGSEYFDGKMDEILIYGRALSDSEVYALAQKEVSGVSSVEVALEQVDFDNLENLGNTENLTWQAASLAQTGQGATTWSYSIPAGLENFYQIHLRSTDMSGYQDYSGIIWRGTIDNLAPRLNFTGQLMGEGTAAQTIYFFTADDLFLDDTTLLQPCTADTLVAGYYPNPPRLNQLSATCTITGHVTSPVTVASCDGGVLCTSLTITPTLASAGIPPNSLVGSAVGGSFPLAGFAVILVTILLAGLLVWQQPWRRWRYRSGQSIGRNDQKPRKAPK